MQKGKKILFTFLFIAILVPMVIPLVYQAKIFLIKLEAEGKLEKNSLQTISIKETAVHWTEQGKEILIDNHLFDVKCFSRENGILTLKGLFDNDENSVKKQLEDFSGLQRSKQDIFLLKYFQFLHTIYFQQNDHLFKTISPSSISYLGEIFFDQKDIFIKIPSPPPQV